MAPPLLVAEKLLDQPHHWTLRPARAFTITLPCALVLSHGMLKVGV
jgi:hypothetical protein